MEAELALAALLGLAVGGLLGLFGAGGSVLTVPALVYLLDQPVDVATAASLAIVAINAGVGAMVAGRDGRVDPDLALRIVIGGVPGALLGAALHGAAPDELVLVVLGLLMIAAAGALGLPGLGLVARFRRRGRGRPRALPVVIGLVVGVATGFAGVGGGFLIVPALLLIVGIPMTVAVGTSLTVVAIASAAGFLGHAVALGSLPLGLVGVLAVAGSAGAVAGLRLGERAGARRLTRGFAVLLVVVAVALIAANVPGAAGGVGG